MFQLSEDTLGYVKLTLVAVLCVVLIMYVFRMMKKDGFAFEQEMRGNMTTISDDVPVNTAALDPYSSLPSEIYESQRQYVQDQEQFPTLNQQHSTDQDHDFSVVPWVGIRKNPGYFIEESSELRSTGSDTATQKRQARRPGISWQ